MFAVIAYNIPRSFRPEGGPVIVCVLATFDTEAKAERVNQRLRRAVRLHRPDDPHLYFVRELDDLPR